MGRSERRRTGSAEGVALAALPLDTAHPLDSLRRGLDGWGYARLFVAALEMDFRKLVTLAVAALPSEIRETGLARLADSEELPRGEAARLYGLVTGLTPAPYRLRLVLPVRLPEAFRLLVENASHRAEDDPVKAYWVPLAAVRRGSITVVDAETVKLDHPLVVFRIGDGNLTVAPPR